MALNGARLFVLENGENTTRIIPIRTNQVKFGSHPSNNIRLRTNLSERLHCKIFVKNEKVYIANYSVDNPVSVNEKKILRREILNNSDTIEIFGTKYRWEFDETKLSHLLGKVKKLDNAAVGSKHGKRRYTHVVRKKQSIGEKPKSGSAGKKPAGKRLSTFTVPKNNRLFLKNLRKRLTVHSIHGNSCTPEESDESESDNPARKTPSPQKVKSSVEIGNDELFFTPELNKENTLPVTGGKSAKALSLQLENSAMIILSYTPSLDTRSKANLRKTPLSAARQQCTPKLRTPYLTPKNDNETFGVTPTQTPSISKAGNSMYLIDLTTPNSGHSSFACSPSNVNRSLSFSKVSSMGMIDLTTPSPKTPAGLKNKEKSLLKSALKSVNKTNLSAAKGSAIGRIDLITPSPKTPTLLNNSKKGLLKSALKNASRTPLSVKRSNAVNATGTPNINTTTTVPTIKIEEKRSSIATVINSRTPVNISRSKLRKEVKTPIKTPVSSNLTASSQQSTPKKSSDKFEQAEQKDLISTVSSDEIFDNLIGRQSVKKTYSRKSDSPKKTPSPLVIVEGSDELPKTDIDLWVESAVANVTSSEMLDIESVMMKPNRTTQIRSSQYSDITPHESLAGEMSFDPNTEAASEDAVVSVTRDSIVDEIDKISDKPRIPSSSHRMSHMLTTGRFESVENKRNTIGHISMNSYHKLTVSPVTKISIKDRNVLSEDSESRGEQNSNDSDNECLMNDSEQGPGENEQLEQAVVCSPRINVSSLKETRKFIGSALTSLNTSISHANNTTGIDDSLLSIDAYETDGDNVEISKDKYSLIDLSAQPATVLATEWITNPDSPTSTNHPAEFVSSTPALKAGNIVTESSSDCLESRAESPEASISTDISVDIFTPTKKGNSISCSASGLSPLAIPLPGTPLKTAMSPVMGSSSSAKTPCLIDKNRVSSEPEDDMGMLCGVQTSSEQSRLCNSPDIPSTVETSCLNTLTVENPSDERSHDECNSELTCLEDCRKQISDDLEEENSLQKGNDLLSSEARSQASETSTLMQDSKESNEVADTTENIEKRATMELESNENGADVGEEGFQSFSSRTPKDDVGQSVEHIESSENVEQHSDSLENVPSDSFTQEVEPEDPIVPSTERNQDELAVRDTFTVADADVNVSNASERFSLRVSDVFEESVGSANSVSGIIEPGEADLCEANFLPEQSEVNNLDDMQPEIVSKPLSEEPLTIDGSLDQSLLETSSRKSITNSSTNSNDSTAKCDNLSNKSTEITAPSTVDKNVQYADESIVDESMADTRSSSENHDVKLSSLDIDESSKDYSSEKLENTGTQNDNEASENMRLTYVNQPSTPNAILGPEQDGENTPADKYDSSIIEEPLTPCNDALQSDLNQSSVEAKSHITEIEKHALSDTTETIDSVEKNRRTISVSDSTTNDLELNLKQINNHRGKGPTPSEDVAVTIEQVAVPSQNTMTPATDTSNVSAVIDPNHVMEVHKLVDSEKVTIEKTSSVDQASLAEESSAGNVPTDSNLDKNELIETNSIESEKDVQHSVDYEENSLPTDEKSVSQNVVTLADEEQPSISITTENNDDSTSCEEKVEFFSDTQDEEKAVESNATENINIDSSADLLANENETSMDNDRSTVNDIEKDMGDKYSPDDPLTDDSVVALPTSVLDYEAPTRSLTRRSVAHGLVRNTSVSASQQLRRKTIGSPLNSNRTSEANNQQKQTSLSDNITKTEERSSEATVDNIDCLLSSDDSEIVEISDKSTSPISEKVLSENAPAVANEKCDTNLTCVCTEQNTVVESNVDKIEHQDDNESPTSEKSSSNETFSDTQNEEKAVENNATQTEKINIDSSEDPNLFGTVSLTNENETPIENNRSTVNESGEDIGDKNSTDDALPTSVLGCKAPARSLARRSVAHGILRNTSVSVSQQLRRKTIGSLLNSNKSSEANNEREQTSLSDNIIKTEECSSEATAENTNDSEIVEIPPTVLSEDAPAVEIQDEERSMGENASDDEEMLDNNNAPITTEPPTSTEPTSNETLEKVSVASTPGDKDQCQPIDDAVLGDTVSPSISGKLSVSSQSVPITSESAIENIAIGLQSSREINESNSNLDELTIIVNADICESVEVTEGTNESKSLIHEEIDGNTITVQLTREDEAVTGDSNDESQFETNASVTAEVENSIPVESVNHMGNMECVTQQTEHSSINNGNISERAEVSEEPIESKQKHFELNNDMIQKVELTRDDVFVTGDSNEESKLEANASAIGEEATLEVVETLTNDVSISESAEVSEALNESEQKNCDSNEKSELGANASVIGEEAIFEEVKTPVSVESVNHMDQHVTPAKTKPIDINVSLAVEGEPVPSSADMQCEDECEFITNEENTITNGEKLPAEQIVAVNNSNISKSAEAITVETIEDVKIDKFPSSDVPVSNFCESESMENTKQSLDNTSGGNNVPVLEKSPSNVIEPIVVEQTTAQKDAPASSADDMRFNGENTTMHTDKRPENDDSTFEFDSSNIVETVEVAKSEYCPSSDLITALPESVDITMSDSSESEVLKNTRQSFENISEINNSAVTQKSPQNTIESTKMNQALAVEATSALSSDEVHCKQHTVQLSADGENTTSNVGKHPISDDSTSELLSSNNSERVNRITVESIEDAESDDSHLSTSPKMVDVSMSNSGESEESKTIEQVLENIVQVDNTNGIDKPLENVIECTPMNHTLDGDQLNSNEVITPVGKCAENDGNHTSEQMTSLENSNITENTLKIIVETVRNVQTDDLPASHTICDSPPTDVPMSESSESEKTENTEQYVESNLEVNTPVMETALQFGDRANDVNHEMTIENATELSFDDIFCEKGIDQHNVSVKNASACIEEDAENDDGSISKQTKPHDGSIILESGNSVKDETLNVANVDHPPLTDTISAIEQTADVPMPDSSEPEKPKPKDNETSVLKKSFQNADESGDMDHSLDGRKTAVPISNDMLCEEDVDQSNANEKHTSACIENNAEHSDDNISKQTTLHDSSNILESHKNVKDETLENVKTDSFPSSDTPFPTQQTEDVSMSVSTESDEPKNSRESSHQNMEINETSLLEKSLQNLNDSTDMNNPPANEAISVPTSNNTFAVQDSKQIITNKESTSINNEKRPENGEALDSPLSESISASMQAEGILISDFKESEISRNDEQSLQNTMEVNEPSTVENHALSSEDALSSADRHREEDVDEKNKADDIEERHTKNDDDAQQVPPLDISESTKTIDHTRVDESSQTSDVTVPAGMNVSSSEINEPETRKHVEQSFNRIAEIDKTPIRAVTNVNKSIDTNTPMKESEESDNSHTVSTISKSPKHSIQTHTHCSSALEIVSLQSDEACDQHQPGNEFQDVCPDLLKHISERVASLEHEIEAFAETDASDTTNTTQPSLDTSNLSADQKEEVKETEEFKTPTAVHSKRKLYTKHDPEDKTPESRKSIAMRPISNDEYLNIMDHSTKPAADGQEKKNVSHERKDDSLDTVQERKVNPTRASRRKIKTLSEEELAGPSPEPKYVKQKVPRSKPNDEDVSNIKSDVALNVQSDEDSTKVGTSPGQDLPSVVGRRKVMFNEHIQIKEINSPSIVGDIIKNVARGRGRKGKQTAKTKPFAKIDIVEESTNGNSVDEIKKIGENDNKDSPATITANEPTTELFSSSADDLKNTSKESHSDDLNNVQGEVNKTSEATSVRRGTRRQKVAQVETVARSTRTRATKVKLSSKDNVLNDTPTVVDSEIGVGKDQANNDSSSKKGIETMKRSPAPDVDEPIPKRSRRGALNKKTELVELDKKPSRKQVENSHAAEETKIKEPESSKLGGNSNDDPCQQESQPISTKPVEKNKSTRRGRRALPSKVDSTNCGENKDESHDHSHEKVSTLEEVAIETSSSTSTDQIKKTEIPHIEESLNESHIVGMMLPSSHTSTPLPKFHAPVVEAATEGVRTRKPRKIVNPTIVALVEEAAVRRSPRGNRTAEITERDECSNLETTGTPKARRQMKKKDESQQTNNKPNEASPNKGVTDSSNKKETKTKATRGRKKQPAAVIEPPQPEKEQVNASTEESKLSSSEAITELIKETTETEVSSTKDTKTKSTRTRRNQIKPTDEIQAPKRRRGQVDTSTEELKHSSSEIRTESMQELNEPVVSSTKETKGKSTRARRNQTELKDEIQAPKRKRGKADVSTEESRLSSSEAVTESIQELDEADVSSTKETKGKSTRARKNPIKPTDETQAPKRRRGRAVAFTEESKPEPSTEPSTELTPEKTTLHKNDISFDNENSQSDIPPARARRGLKSKNVQESTTTKRSRDVENAIEAEEGREEQQPTKKKRTTRKAPATKKEAASVEETVKPNEEKAAKTEDAPEVIRKRPTRSRK